MSQNDNSRKIAGRYVAYLIDCALHDAPSEPIEKSIPWEDIHAISCSNDVEALCWFGISEHVDLPDELRNVWKQEADLTLLRCIRFDFEREQIFAELASRGISYMPLRGTVLASYYPKPGMRSMSDNDFLYGFVEYDDCEGAFRLRGETAEEQASNVEAALKVVEDVMRSRGYEVAGLRGGHHDSYHKEPGLNFEPHRMLMAPESPLAAYYENSWEHAVRDSLEPHSFRLSDEDEYIYLLAHAFKHYDRSGCGIRFVVDMRVFLDAKGDSLDFAYIDAELEKLGISEFERIARALADEAFGGACRLDAPLSEESADLLDYLLNCTTYGTFFQTVRNALEKHRDSSGGDAGKAKRGYVRARLLDEQAVQHQFPRASRYTALRPVLHVVRLVRGLARNHRRIARELSVLFKER